MPAIKVYTQAELDKALAGLKSGEWVECRGDLLFVLRGSSHAELRDSSHAVLRDSSHAVLRDSSHAVLWDSSHAVLWDSSHAELRDSSRAVLWNSSRAELRNSSHAVLWNSSRAVLRNSSHAVLRDSSHAELRDSSHAELWNSSRAELWNSSHAALWNSSRAELWNSSHAALRDSSHAELRNSSHAELWDSSRAGASRYAALHIHGSDAKAKGGVQIKVPISKTARDWCAFYGVTVEAGLAILFKAVRDDFRSAHGTLYAPGSTPKADDWDGGKAECGGGLHFSFHPQAAKEFDSCARRFVACPVLLKHVKVHPNAEYPEKIKASQVDAPIWECDEHGEPIK